LLFALDLTHQNRSGIVERVAICCSEKSLMAITTDDLCAFYHFAQAMLASGGAQSLHELVDIWEIEHSTPELHAQNVAAVQAAIRDMQNGDTGRPGANVLDELRAELAGGPDTFPRHARN
jgi:hypothetical protein